jgi:hypothetical protein
LASSIAEKFKEMMTGSLARLFAGDGYDFHRQEAML